MRNKIIIGLLTAGLLATAGCSSTATRETSKGEANTNTVNTNTVNTNTTASTQAAAGSNPRSPPTATTDTVNSIYTELDGKGCGPWRDTGEVSSERTCSGIEGYKLRVESHDARDTITIITPDGRQHPLNFSQTISNGGFASLGQKAEWRVVNRNGKDVPTALIVRVEVQTGDAKTKSYLSVSKISEGSICVTDRIEPTADANERARVAADAAASKPCLSSS